MRIIILFLAMKENSKICKRDYFEENYLKQTFTKVKLKYINRLIKV